MKTFYAILANTLIANVTNSFLWFSLTFWAYLETQSVVATSMIGGSFMLLTSFSALLFGGFVDRHTKKQAMLVSSGLTLVMYALAGLLFAGLQHQQFVDLTHPFFWIFVLCILIGAVAGNMRGIALSTLVTILVEKDDRDNANGLVGTVNGIAFAITSVFSGLVVGFLGMPWALGIAFGLTLLTCAHLITVQIAEPEPQATQSSGSSLDVGGTIRAIKSVPGLFGLIIFTTFNNLLGGVFMALMDAYGLSLVSVQTWGILWGFLSFGFIIGGMTIAKFGLTDRPLRVLLLTNVLMWTLSTLFTVRASISLTAVGIFFYTCLVPVVEAVEQTIVQRLVPLDRQGRVFGFAHSIETAATPITAFIIGPITQYFFIPFMTTGKGVQLFGPILGVGPGRGIALVFVCAGLIGLSVTLMAFFTRTYRILSTAYVRTNRA